MASNLREYFDPRDFTSAALEGDRKILRMLYEK